MFLSRLLHRNPPPEPSPIPQRVDQLNQQAAELRRVVEQLKEMNTIREPKT